MKHNDTTARERHQVLKNMLEDRRAEIHDKLRMLRETFPAGTAEVTDPEEQSVEFFIRDLDMALMEMKAETLGKIDEAIQRLQHGQYGTCAECGVEIAEPRLQALPFATLCLGCQEREETREAEGRVSETRATKLSDVETTLLT